MSKKIKLLVVSIVALNTIMFVPTLAKADEGSRPQVVQPSQVSTSNPGYNEGTSSRGDEDRISNTKPTSPVVDNDTSNLPSANPGDINLPNDRWNGESAPSDEPKQNGDINGNSNSGSSNSNIENSNSNNGSVGEATGNPGYDAPEEEAKPNDGGVVSYPEHSEVNKVVIGNGGSTAEGSGTTNKENNATDKVINSGEEPVDAEEAYKAGYKFGQDLIKSLKLEMQKNLKENKSLNLNAQKNLKENKVVQKKYNNKAVQDKYNNKAVKTSDNNSIYLYLTMMALGALGMFVMVKGKVQKYINLK